MNFPAIAIPNIMQTTSAIMLKIRINTGDFSSCIERTLQILTVNPYPTTLPVTLGLSLIPILAFKRIRLHLIHNAFFREEGQL